mgnify:CR=1 FL=1
MEDLQAGHQLEKDNMEIMIIAISMVDKNSIEETIKMEEISNIGIRMHMEKTNKTEMLNFENPETMEKDHKL